MPPRQRAAPADAPSPGARGVTLLAATLLLCALACAGLLVARWAISGHASFFFLGWNLFLAGLPFLFAMLAFLALEPPRIGPSRIVAAIFLLVLWLLFFPNAPYMVTDLTHIPFGSAGAPRWFDSILFGAFAATGVTSGIASLLLVQSLTTRRGGRVLGWVTIAGAAVLGGYGIVLGRFLRFNSWDALSRPRPLFDALSEGARSPLAHPRTTVAAALYAGFILLAYAVVVALLAAGRHLLPAENRGRGGR